ncbi:enoyl-CoA hydratase/isomerase family protein [Paraburkholderia solisilvae]|uniref:1,4-dihydroxy-2-naphthoyl-CoA synthase n=1 Tax=Paraburkholderia solisilvae TaxID=624376 RepID=A0A6J5DT75_9BURK|nr:enoyl-CoA hydratase/isomerase family protein [Paraburkholderia solisilvae]CAB3757123.1 1,4-dihydroxy-2-naphthoyl-CoA synthase [Paraburkholderia solisilvae]
MSLLAIEKHREYWSVTLNRPEKLNALSAELVEQLITVFDEIAAANVPVVILQGEGRCFSAGFDMSDVERFSEGDLLLRFVRVETLLQRVAASPALTVAFAHGKNFGAGVDLIAACNLRVAAPGTTFRMPGLQFGLVLGTGRFARIVGQHEAKRILETSETFDVHRAFGNCFIERVAPLEQRDHVIADAVARATSLPAASRALLSDALREHHADADLAALVRSAAEPGLKHRIDAYRNPAASTRSQHPQKETS